jgi:alkaline phosphatase
MGLTLLMLVVACGVSGDTATVSTTTPTTETSQTTPPTATGTLTTVTETSTVITETATTSTTLPDVLGPVVILFIGDGMGFEHVRGAGYYVNGVEGSLFMESLGVTGRGKTASLSALTDSAASATAMATGVKTLNARIGQDADENNLENILEFAETYGWSVGVVTNDKVVGATPASFLAHVESRGDSEGIAAQIIKDPPDVLFGGGFSYLLDSDFSSDVQYITTKSDLLKLEPDGRAVIGLFGSAGLPYVYDDDGTTPSLAEMTVAALDYIGHDPEGTLLIVEGARIDHASHTGDQDRVFLEVVSLDQAVEAAAVWTVERDATIIVTADHECGGLHIDPTGAVAGIPVETQWMWGDHTNDDVPVFASGMAAPWVDGVLLQNNWIYSVLRSIVSGETLVEPSVPWLVDGDVAELGPVVATAIHDTNAGVAFNQLDTLRVASDAEGIWIGVEGVVESDANSFVVLIDSDFGAGSGVTSGGQLADDGGLVDALLSNLSFTVLDARLGFDAASVLIHGRYTRPTQMLEDSGVRVWQAPMGELEDFFWSSHASNIDSGNLSRFGIGAVDAGVTGETIGGVEVQIPWTSLFAKGLPAKGASLAFVVTLTNDDGTWISNQTLPATAATGAVGVDGLEISSFVTMTVSGTGAVTAGPVVE